MSLKKIMESKEYLEKRFKKSPEIAMILGSGLGVLADEIKDKIIIKYEDIPNFPKSTVKGHKGQLVFGELMGKKVIAMQGRFHYYEGYDMKQVVFPVRVMNMLGAKKLLVTNAAGGVNKNFKPGDLMIIEDHINFAFNNPLIGKNHNDLGPRFPDMSHAYSADFIDIALETAKEIELQIKKGTYMFLTGPTYETPAEVKVASYLGADAVGMSTVPEVISAVHMKMKVLGISCITNMAAGILDKPLDHKEVIETSERIKDQFIMLTKNIIKKL
ncbi:purine-nucleoside phosphorylase [Clostridiisalibacter paucivorans]|uniref:purine-nucleoside phosphorylase n=1 Tax=Clostridiisalibacter paucivorans TaxID=408753 RepID=UPI00047E38D3